MLDTCSIMHDSRAIADPAKVDRLQWYGFVAGVLAAFVSFISAYAFNRNELDQLLSHESDGWGYYQYLPTLIGTHYWEHMPWSVRLPNASELSLFSYGVALLQLPWFLLGHCLAWARGSPMNGYSAPYAMSIFLGVAFYVGVATSLLFQALRRRFSPSIALAVPILLFAGTNLYYYATRQPAMSHAYVYFLFAALHYLVIRNIERASPYRTAGIILICSLAILIRQVHVVVSLFPLLYLVADGPALRERLRWITQRPWAIVGAILLACALWLPQLAYWKLITTDTYVVFPYSYKNEHFDFLWRPHLIDVLTSVINGWWIYTPLMALACLWLVRMAWHKDPGGRLVLLIVVLVWYTYAAWWCWWLGGSFGHRGFVEYYALLAIPLAHGIEHVRRMHWSWRSALGIILAAFMWASMRMTAEYDWAWSEPGWTWEKLFQVWRSLI